MLPEMTLLEMLTAVKHLRDMALADRKTVVQKIIRYFFTNPAEISICPFLSKKECRIYKGRFFGCRAYGLWSPEYYREIADQSRRGKKILQKQWKMMGIDLPEQVVDYQVPYCRDVDLQDDVNIDDQALIKSSEQIHRLSLQFQPWHQIFEQTYFSDLSFLVSSLVFGINRTVQIKLALVRDMLLHNDRSQLERVLSTLPDTMFHGFE